MDKIIFHIDVNSAFLSWEAVDRINRRKAAGVTIEGIKDEIRDIREMKVAIGGDISTRHGVILAKSIPAGRCNVRTGESIVEAKKKCPELMVIPPNHEMYKKYSEAFMRILREYTPDVEQFSIDEAFMDMTGTRLLFGEPIEAAVKIKERIKNELGFTVNIGISSNKLLAKMASDFEKPDKIHTLFPEEIQKKMWGRPVSELFFVGSSTAAKLAMMGIKTIGELAETDVEILRLHLKKQGEVIWNFANGVDFSVVQSEPSKNKGYGNSTTISYDVKDSDTAKLILLSLTETVAERLRKDGVRIETVSVGIKDNNFKSSSHQRVLTEPTNVTSEIYSVVCTLFDELWDGTPIRLLGVQTSKVVEKDIGRQLTLFDDGNHEKMEKLDEAVDKMRNKYGRDIVKLASFYKK